MGDFAFQHVQLIQPRWLRLKDAARYSALGEKRLVSLAKEGLIREYQDRTSRRGIKGAASRNGEIVGEWIFDRLSLDEYRLAQAEDQIVNQTAAGVLARLGHVL